MDVSSASQHYPHMQPDLLELKISDQELRDLTGVDLNQRSNPSKKPFPLKLLSIIGLLSFLTSFICQAVFFVPAFRIPAIAFVVSALLGVGSIALELAEIAVIGLLAGVGAGIYAIYTLAAAAPANFIAINLLISGSVAIASTLIFWRLQRARSPQSQPQVKHFKNLVGEVAKYNKVIKDIDIFDQLEAAGNPISFSDRHGVISALAIAKRDLVRALKTERILRDNPEFNPALFEIDLSAFQALQISERASEYGRLFNITMQIAIDVQREMQELQGFS
jgi:hypothetical protein